MKVKFDVIYDLGYGHFNVRMKDTIEAMEFSTYNSKEKKAREILKEKHPNRTFIIQNIKQGSDEVDGEETD